MRVPWRRGDDGRPRAPRYGLRTLGFLALAFVAIVTAMAMGHHTVGTLGSSVFGLVGAGISSVRGLRAALREDWVKRMRR